MPLKATNYVVAFGASCALIAGAAAASNVVWHQSFETDTAGWFDSSNGWAGSVTRVASGHNGVTSSSGDYHAVVVQGPHPSASIDTGGFSQFDGYRSVWPAGGFRAAIDVYLDMSMSIGEGFDYSVAANRQTGAHLRDFIFHVARDADGIVVGGSNNSNFTTQNRKAENHHLVTTSGWFTLEHVFRDFGDGSLAVDLNLLDSGGDVLFTETRHTADDLIATIVGGNRYSWFTHVSVDGGIAVDSHMLSIIPLPTPIGLGAVGLMGVFAVRRRRA
ncbi:MAG: hypothetical protein EA379_09640 [Phycisphaerales bacterium]|nr:MAG: hypothetical protein EA379_09640 [Phycisphaerales bacterium]